MYAGYFIIIASKKPFKTIIGKEKRRKICHFCAQAWGSKDQSKSVNSRKGTEFKRIYYI